MSEFKDFYWLNEESRIFLSKDEGYLPKGVTAEDRLKVIADTAEKYLGIEGFSDKFFGYLAKGYYSLSTPVWCNYGTNRGLPVSCFGSYIPDDMYDILNKNTEVGIMTKCGGGTSGYFGDIRARGSVISRGGHSTGPVEFMELFDKSTSVITQGSARRGAFAAYLPLEHPDILEFLKIRSDGHEIQEMSLGVTVSDEWMDEMEAGDKEKRKIWAAMIKKKYETGYPYIVYTGNANRNKPQVYKDKNMEILASNLCSEIMLPSSADESFVCVLSSINLLHWDEIAKTDAVETLLMFLDTVNEEFVQKSANIRGMEAPHKFAKNHRALGLGVLGWHSLLQSKMIPFESMEAKFLNTQIFSEINKRTLSASQELAKMFGETELLKGYGVRNATRVAIAPTTSSSFILGQVSPSIEPLNSNYFVKDLAKGKFTYKNPAFFNLLREKNMETPEVLKSMLKKGGSIQHLEFLSDHEKAVFKTFDEISPKEILIQASARQPHIDQGQSINIVVPPKTPAKQVSELMIEARKMNIKSLYYQRSANPAQQLSRNINVCTSCEG